MEVPNKTHRSNNKDKKRVAIKSGGGVGVGFGAVVMFGGALATAALASAFLFKKKGLSSAKDRRGQPPEIKKQSEKEAAEEEIRTVSVDGTSLHAQKHRSEDVKENFETSDDSCLINGGQNLSQDELPGRETIVGIADDVEERDGILRSEALSFPEADVISDDSSVVKKDFQLDEKSSVDLDGPLKDAKIQLDEEDSPANELDLNEIYDSDLVTVNEEEKDVRTINGGGGEISEVNDQYAVVTKDEQSIEEEDRDTVVIKELQVIEDNRTKPEMNLGEAEYGEEVVGIDNMEACKSKMIQESHDEMGLEEGILCNKDDTVTWELEEDDQKRIQTTDDGEFQVPVLEEELISPGDIQDKGCDSDNVSQLKDFELGADVTLEINCQLCAEKTIEEDGISYEPVGEKGRDIIEYETDSSELHSVDSSKESNSEAVWPAENLQDLKSIEPQELKLFSGPEVEGKILEDKAVKERELHQSKAEGFKADSQIETAKGRSTSPYKRRLAIALLLTISSILGSLIFGLSLTKLCFVAFLTMVLSEMNA